MSDELEQRLLSDKRWAAYHEQSAGLVVEYEEQMMGDPEFDKHGHELEAIKQLLRLQRPVSPIQHEPRPRLSRVRRMQAPMCCSSCGYYCVCIIPAHLSKSLYHTFHAVFSPPPSSSPGRNPGPGTGLGFQL